MEVGKVAKGTHSLHYHARVHHGRDCRNHGRAYHDDLPAHPFVEVATVAKDGSWRGCCGGGPSIISNCSSLKDMRWMWLRPKSSVRN
ncbi:hypothetical protein SAY87_029930 [Trapa incisa]|uniref:Uncharacterized protein n=1 Tax=Trapa incisa TaxID=236973 RepID=A0AAN7Q9I9_9MYRT|nr:hypothetical protein SAY87_029930 [Trapa incisa]